MRDYENKDAESALSPQRDEGDAVETEDTDKAEQDNGTLTEGSGGGRGRQAARARTERRATLSPAQKRADTIAARRRSARAAQGVQTRRANAETRRRAALSPQQRAAETRRARRAGLPNK